MNKAPVVNLNDVDKVTIGNGANFAANVARLGPLLGMKDLGCSLVELEPGQKGWPYHLHYGIEELFVVIEGEGSLRYNDEMSPIRSGDVIFAPTGDGTAHQIINSSDAPLRYLALSTMVSPEVCYYPDSGKYGSYSFSDPENVKAFMAHEADAREYYDGEWGEDDEYRPDNT